MAYSDHIGRIGERAFDLLVERVGLLAGRIDPDCLGIDRLIEFEPSHCNGAVSYDLRPVPIGCNVQIKTINRSKNRAKLTLSVAERLAGNLRPAFICILRVGDDGELFDMYFVHLMDDNLAKILKRLREISVNRLQKKLNKATTSFSISDWQKVDSSPSALREAIVQFVGNDMHAYAARKANQRKTLGFKESGRLTVNISFAAMPVADLVDGFLGLRPLAVSRFETLEERFDIKLPFGPLFRESAAGFVEFTSTSGAPGTLTISDPDAGDSVSVKCSWNTPPINKIPIEYFKILARSRFADVIFRDQAFDFTTKDKINFDEPMLISDWLLAFKILDLVTRPRCTFTLVNDQTGHQISGESKSDVDQKTTFIRSAQLLLKKTHEIREYAEALDVPMSLRSICRCGDEIERIHNYIFQTSKLSHLGFKMEDPGFPIDIPRLILYVGLLELGNELYGYALRTRMICEKFENILEWRSTEIVPLAMESIKDQAGDYERFRRKMGRISGIDMCFSHAG